MVCKNCLEALQTPAKSGDNENESSVSATDGEMTMTLGELRANMEECFFCRYILNGLIRSTEKTPQDNEKIKIRYVMRQAKSNDQPASINLSAFPEHTPRFLRMLLIENVAQVDRVVHTIKGSSTGSLEALTFLKNQFTTCMQSHGICLNLLSELIWYPTRLVEVFNDGARIIDTSETAPSGPYASLSHRWGGSNIFCCTSDILPRLKTALPVSELPLTFQQAIEVIKFLGIKYIWIDSLCIVQDWDEDWAREAKMMMKVYEQACINLAATVSSGGESGLFATRDPSTLLSPPFQISNKVVDGQCQVIESVLDTDAWGEVIETAPLNKRGWVLQERLLSPRVAHFTADQVIWDCSQGTTTESIPSGFLVNPLRVTSWTGRKQNSKLYTAPSDQDAIMSEWAMVVYSYSKCQLTYDTDKIIAMDGLQSVFEHILGSKFFCAIPRIFMELQLCWYTSDSNFSQVSRTDIAPSWSWASIKGTVEMPHPYRYTSDGYIIKYFAQVEDVTFQAHRGKGRTETYTGSLFLRGTLKPVQLHTSEEGKVSLLGDGTQHVFNIGLDTPSVMEYRDLYLFPMFDVQDPHTVTWKNRYSEARCLLLRSLDETSGKFVRCGHVGISARTDPATGDFPSSWLSLISRDGDRDGALPCKEFDREKGYLVEVV